MRKPPRLCFAANAVCKFLGFFQKRRVAVYFSKEPFNFLNRRLFRLSPGKLLHHSLAYWLITFINLSITNLGLKGCFGNRWLD